MTTTIPPQVELSRAREQSRRQDKQAKKIRDILKSTVSHGLIIFIGLFFAVPFIWMLLTAFKSNQDVFHSPPRWLPYDNVRVDVNGEQLPLYDVKLPDGTIIRLAAAKIFEGVGTFVDPENPSVIVDYELQQVKERIAEAVMHVSFRWQNFPDAMNRGSRPGVGASFWVYFKNSLIIAFFVIIGTLISNTPVAYAFARSNFPGRDILFVIVLATMMLPFQVTMIPIYLLFNDTLGWGDTFLPLIIPTFFANAWDVFLLRQFFRTIPEEMCDAARVDGASEWQIFTRIVIPLSTPVLLEQFDGIEKFKCDNCGAEFVFRLSGRFRHRYAHRASQAKGQTMTLVKKADGWWIVHVPTRDVPEYGPYSTKADADDDRKRMERFFENNPDYRDVEPASVAPPPLGVVTQHTLF